MSIWEIIAEAKSRASSCSNLTEQERLQKLAESENAMVGSKNLTDGYNCDICKNRGYIIKTVESDGMWENVQCTCKCERSRKSIRNLKASGLANVIDYYRFDNFKATEEWQKGMYELAKTFSTALDSNEWLFMGGQSGSGKTHLCSAAAIELLRRGKEVKYMLWRDESRKIKDDNFNGGKLIEYYKDVEVLYIDDLFKTGKAYGDEVQKPTAGDINLAFEIVNSRVAQKKKTIISSESTIFELFDIDEAVAGRIKQMCGAYCISISKDAGKNYRKRF